MRPVQGVRDSGGKGFRLRPLLLSFDLFSDLFEASDAMRAGRVFLNGEPIKDILYEVMPGTYQVRIDGKIAAEIVVI